jgi:hypothetical protein
VVESAPVVEPAPVVVPPVVVVDKDGNVHKAPVYCTVAELDAVAGKVAVATKQAVLLNRLASAAREAASLLRAKATTLNKPKAAAALDLARTLEASADKLAAQAQKLVDEAAKKKCEVAPISGGRF